MATQFGFPPTTTYNAPLPTTFGYRPPPPPPVQTGVDLRSFGGAPAVPTAPNPGAALLRATASNTTTAPTPPGYRQAATGALSGLSAVSQIAPGTDPASAGISAGASAATGAAVGFAMGGPVGALVGGGAGALSSLVNSWMTIKAERKRARARRRLLAEAERKQAERDRIARQDAIESEKYDRKQAAARVKWDQTQSMLMRLEQAIQANAAMKKNWVATGATGV